MLRISKHVVLLFVLLGVFISGCATKRPSFGEAVMAEGNVVAEIGEKWEKGQAMIRKGNKLIRKGNKQLSAGKENVADGAAMVKTGEKLVADAEKEYERTRPISQAN